ncbi:hypothetical protein FRC08_006499 [Ceratobasidium sp. 394]|nr:hypothetical protein FRC08_006499 [Ceratobasidium sp. 394]KAG9101433.1 hypothetical protein FS749_006936 [Ceratobasidium sp. UAMH 11750]
MAQSRPESIKLRVLDEPPAQDGSGLTAEELLKDYLDMAVSKQKYQYRLAKLIAWSLNVIIILQVIFSALVTVVTSLEPTPRTRIASVVLGALATVTASLVARAKGTNQPELAETHAKDLEKFIARCRLFIKEAGSASGDQIKEGVMKLVELYEAIEDKATQAYRGRETPATSQFKEPLSITTPAPTARQGQQPVAPSAPPTEDQPRQ